MIKKYSDGKPYKVIAFALSNFANDEQIHIMENVVEVCRAHQVKVNFYSTITDLFMNDVIDQGERSIFHAIQVEKYDAIVLMSESFKQDEEMYELVATANRVGVPIFAVDKYLEGAINLAFEYERCFKEVVEHMVEHHGYKRVNFMGGMPGNTYSEVRLQAYKDVLEKNGIPFDERRVYYGYFWEDPAIVAMEQMLDSPLPFPEAIICANDAMALPIVNFLQKNGFRVPEDVAVSGFDGIDMERYSVPRLTTGVVNNERMMELICEMLENGVDDLDRSKVIPIYSKMQIGHSCGCDSLSSEYGITELIRMRSELHQLIKFQGDVQKMVSKYSTKTDFTESIKAIARYSSPVKYREAMLTVEEDFVENLQVEMYTGDAVKTHHEKTMTTAYIVNGERYNGNQIKRNVTPETIDRFICDSMDKYDYMMHVPMHVKGVGVGVMSFLFYMEEMWFTAASSFMTDMRNLFELVTAQAQLMRVYLFDMLTGLYNRQGFYQKVEGALKKAKELDESHMTVISIDMDGLKMINDTYGHNEGDAALRNFGQMIKRSIDKEIAARIGGDEFLIVFTGDYNYSRAAEIVASIKKEIAAYNERGLTPYEIHASIGCYTDNIHTQSLDDFLSKADKLMYEKKAQHKSFARND